MVVQIVHCLFTLSSIFTYITILCACVCGDTPKAREWERAGKKHQRTGKTIHENSTGVQNPGLDAENLNRSCIQFRIVFIAITETWAACFSLFTIWFENYVYTVVFGFLVIVRSLSIILLHTYHLVITGGELANSRKTKITKKVSFQLIIQYRQSLVFIWNSTGSFLLYTISAYCSFCFVYVSAILCRYLFGCAHWLQNGIFHLHGM